MRRCCLALIALVSLAATPGAQSPSPDSRPQPPSSISIATHPTADGRAVRDLTAADLDRPEDGTPQKIEPLTPPAGPARSFVVFLDTPHMRFEGARDVRVALVRFLDRLLGEDDIVGVMTPEMTPPDIRFGPKESIIPAIMQDETFWERARVGSSDPKEDRYAQCFPANEYREVASEMQERHREQATLDAFSRLVDFLSTRDARTAVITLTDGWRLFGPSGRLSSNISSSRPGGFGGSGGGGGRGRGGFPGGGGFPRGGGGQGGANPPPGGRGGRGRGGGARGANRGGAGQAAPAPPGRFRGGPAPR